LGLLQKTNNLQDISSFLCANAVPKVQQMLM
jgi:hypothetical protein